MPIYRYILVHITDVELLEPTFQFGRLELNEDTNTELLTSGNAMKVKEKTMKEE